MHAPAQAKKRAPAAVRAWHADLARSKGSKVMDRPTARAHAYGLLRMVRAKADDPSGAKLVLLVKGPNSDAGRRDVTIPPHLLPAVTDHVMRHAQVGSQGLLFPAGDGGHLVPSTLYRVFYPEREAAGRPDLRFHDLRHTGATRKRSAGSGTRSASTTSREISMSCDVTTEI